MPSNRFPPKFEPITFDPAGAFLEEAGLSRADVAGLLPQLEASRSDVLAAELPAAALIELPNRLLAEYQAKRRDSRVGQILTVAKRLADAVDRVIVLGDSGSCLAARALFESCCHPFHNELGRGDRGGKPRLYFLERGFDNDATQGLLDLVGHGRRTATIDERWGLIAIDSINPEPTATTGPTNDVELPTIVALRSFLGALRNSCGGDATALAHLVVTVVAPGGPLGDIAKSLGCPDMPPISSGAGEGPATFTSATILLAAVLGLDVMRLLEGAAAMTQRFRTAPPGDNPALDFAAVCHLLGASPQMLDRELLTWTAGMTAVGAWFDALFRATLGEQGRGAARRLAVNLIVDQPRRDRLVDPQSGQPLSGLLAVAIERTKKCQSLAGTAAVDIHLPIQDESCLGQLFQMMLLSAAVENRVRR